MNIDRYKSSTGNVINKNILANLVTTVSVLYPKSARFNYSLQYHGLACRLLYSFIINL